MISYRGRAVSNDARVMRLAIRRVAIAHANRKQKAQSGSGDGSTTRIGILICFLASRRLLVAKENFQPKPARPCAEPTPVMWLASIELVRACAGAHRQAGRELIARAASAVDVEFLTATEFFDRITGSPQAARELIQCLIQRLHEADDRIVSHKRRSGLRSGSAICR
jgi:hypothetical protein